jgi:hypothetical protein
MSLTYIYGLQDPRTKELRYIGKANDPTKRLSKHLRDARRKVETHKEAWIRGLLQLELEPRLVLLMQVPMKGWQRVERILLRSLTESGYDLVNRAEGGLGGATRKGRKVLPETRRKMSEAHKKLWTDERRATWSERAKKQHQDPEFQKKHQEGLEQAKPKISESQQRRWTSEEERQRQSEIGKRNWKDPELSALMRRKVAECWQDPKYRERQRLARIEAWKKRRKKKDTQ